MAYLAVGNKIADFSLKNQDGVEINQNSFPGKKLLIYFYPKAMTPGCTTQACGLRDTQKELSERNVVVLGVSPDLPAKLKKFQDRDQLNFDLLSDPEHTLADSFGTWGPKKFMGKEYDGIHRISFLINQDGIVEHVFEKFKTSDHHTVVLNFLDSQ